MNSYSWLYGLSVLGVLTGVMACVYDFSGRSLVGSRSGSVGLAPADLTAWTLAVCSAGTALVNFAFWVYHQFRPVRAGRRRRATIDQSPPNIP
jgi:H+/Cl- antiporter ClcA